MNVIVSNKYSAMLSSLSTKIDLIKTIDTIFKNKVAFVRMIQDGRCNSLVEMASYVSVYNKYPDREITDSMLKNHYGIKSLFRLNS